MAPSGPPVKRVFASVVVFFIVPPVLLLFVLSHEIVTGIDWVDRYLRAVHLLLAFSSAQHPEFWWWVIGMLAVGFVSFAAADWVTELLSRNIMQRIGELLDRDGLGAPEISSQWDWSRLFVSTHGQFHHRDVTVTLRVSYAQRFNRNGLGISFACRSPWPFRIERKTLAARALALFDEPHARIGDAELDRNLLFVPDEQAFSTWMHEPENRRAVLELTVGPGASSIEARSDDAPILRIKYAGFSFFRRNPVLRHMPEVLDTAELLAGSLENHSVRGAAGPVQRHEPRGEAPTVPSTPRLARRRTGKALVVGGVLLLTGLPSTVFYGLGGQPSDGVMWLLTVLPWLGVGLLIAGVRRWRRA
jgi:hypothetical protein